MSKTLFTTETQPHQAVTSEAMSTDLVTRELTPLAIIQTAIAQPDIDPLRLQGFIDLFERLEQSAAADAYGEAIALFQAKCPQITKNRQIDLGGGKGPLYAGLDDIMKVIKPLLGECGLSVTFSASLTEAGAMKAVCSVRKGRHVENSEITLAVPTQMRVNDTQRMGAALSYAKRYALCAALNIVLTDEDTDAATLMETVTEEQIAVLKEHIEATNTDIAKFCKWLAVGSLAEIPASQFQPAVFELKRKAAKK